MVPIALGNLLSAVLFLHSHDSKKTLYTDADDCKGEVKISISCI